MPFQSPYCLLEATVKTVYSFFRSFLRVMIYFSEAYSKTCHTSKMDLFEKTANGFQPITIFTKSSILDVLKSFE